MRSRRLQVRSIMQDSLDDGLASSRPDWLYGDCSTRAWVGGRHSMLQRYACVRQRDMMDCGAAALATVALHYRRPIGLEQLRELTGTDRAGTNLLGLVQAAEHLGFSAKAVKGLYE